MVTNEFCPVKMRLRDDLASIIFFMGKIGKMYPPACQKISSHGEVAFVRLV